MIENLAETLSDLEGKVRSHPSNVKYRIFLFQLLSVRSEWKRAGKQLDVIRKLDDGALPMVQMYETAISCELYREAVFRGEYDPVFLGEPEEWQALLLQAFKLGAKGSYSKSQEIREQAFEIAPVSAGQLDGEEFSWIADADSRMGPMLEMIVEGKYMWVSFAHIATITIDEPTDLRDVVWLPCHVCWQNGGEAYALIPSRYPGSERKEQSALGRLTEWDSVAEGQFVGFGQKHLSTDSKDYPLLNIREINFPVKVADDLEVV